MTASEQALLREAEAEQDMALLKLLLKKLHGARAIAPDPAWNGRQEATQRR